MEPTTATATLTPAQAYEEHALKVLKNAGLRVTMPRVQVIRALADTVKALSAYAIHAKIHAGGGKIDVVSVYRILETLQVCELVDHIGVVDGYYPRHTQDGNPFAYILDDDGDVSTLSDLNDVCTELKLRAQEALGIKVDTIKIEMVGVKA